MAPLLPIQFRIFRILRMEFDITTELAHTNSACPKHIENKNDLIPSEM